MVTLLMSFTLSGSDQLGPRVIIVADKTLQSYHQLFNSRAPAQLCLEPAPSGRLCFPFRLIGRLLFLNLRDKNGWSHIRFKLQQHEKSRVDDLPKEQR
jgi:hypothetical protein